MAEVDHLFRMTDGPCAALILMARVGSSRRIPEPQSLRHFIVQALNRSCETAIPDAHEFAVPVLRRHPELHVDEGVGGWFQHELNAAMRRKICYRGSASSSRGRRRSTCSTASASTTS